MPLIFPDDVEHNERDYNVPATLIQDMLSSKSTVQTTANLIIANITNSRHPAVRRHRFWKILFAGVISAPTSFLDCWQLLRAIQAHPATEAMGFLHGTTSGGQLHWHSLPDFDTSWREVYKLIQSNRDKLLALDNVDFSDIPAEFPSATGISAHVRFVRFSSRALGNGIGHIDPIFVFRACAEVLERGLPKIGDSRMSKLLWTDEIVVACSWLIHGARGLFETDPQSLRRQHGNELDQARELWPRSDGLTRARWVFWSSRLDEVAQLVASRPTPRPTGSAEVLQAGIKAAADTINGLLGVNTPTLLGV